MFHLSLAIALFVISHVAIARGGLKALMIERLGKPVYLAVYSLVSVVLLGWIVRELLATPRVELWQSPDWAYGFALALSGAAFAVLGAGCATANPLSVSFRKVGYDPKDPGIVGWVRHPVLLGFGLWGAAHVPANGDHAALLCFGGVVVFAVVGACAVSRRVRRNLGPAELETLTPGRGALDRNAVIGGGAGLVVWALFLIAHPHLFGVDPLALALSAD